MTESVVQVVLGKLGDAQVKEVLLLYGIDEQVETVSRELSHIRAFLKDANKKHITDDMQKHWLKEVTDVVYSVEDVIDTFLMEVTQKPQKPSMMVALKRLIKRTKKLPAVHRLIHEINQIQTRLNEIEKRRVRYGIDNLGEGGGEIILPVRPPMLPDIDPNIIGFEADQVHLVNELLDENTKRRSVVSIWGFGGVGKTTLARNIFNCNDAKARFGHRIWIAISQNFELINILRKITQQLKLNEQSKEDVFLVEIHKSLRGKRYLIVLDDVWTSDIWIQIEAAFPDENNGSRVLITTRFFDVAKYADPTCEPYKLGFLTNELSRELLLKTAFNNLDPNKSSFDDLSDIIDQFVHKCGGLPLALVVLGGLLSKKPHTSTAWSKVLQTMSWHVDGNNFSEILVTSYEALPFVLKTCFMYFAAFPEYYNIHASSILQMWIAEGFIPQEDNKTLEETAETFLEDLVQRSMVQVDSRSFDGSIEYLRIHDILRDLVIEKAKEDNFFMVYSHPDDQIRLSRVRRLAIHNPDCDPILMSQNLRTLLCFHNGRVPNCSKQRLLKVVSTGDDWNTVINLEMFEGFTQLRYLNLTGRLGNECKEECLEKVIGGMKFLQTLNVQFELPDCAWHIKTLRHVNQIGLGPPPSAELTNLQTLTSMRIRESWETKLPILSNLRKLELEHTSSSLWHLVVTFLGTLKCLISLEICGDPVPSDILDMRGFPFYQHLQYLTLIAKVGLNANEMILHEDMLPRYLISLQITGYKIQQDLMPVLEKLRCLKKLQLYEACQNRKFSCSAGGFSQLEVLYVGDLFMLEEWEIEEGAMPILKELRIIGCAQLGVPQGLQYLTNLQKLKWPYVKNADLVCNLCKHVPSLDFN